MSAVVLRMGLAWSSRARRRVMLPIEIIARESGIEHRIATTARALRSFEFDACEVATAEAEDLASLLEQSGGALRSFLLCDPLEYKSCGPGESISALNQSLGVGDGVRKRFALIKSVGEGASLSVRSITNPVVGTVTLAVGGNSVPGSAYALSAGGIVDFNSAPATGATVSAGYLFETPVRLDGEAPTFRSVNDRLCAVGAFRLREVMSS